MPANYKAELVGVFGYPVAENPTGVMQEAAFAAAGLNWRYLTIEVKPDDLNDAFRGLRAMGMQGINLTIPHKVAVLSMLDEISADAALIGAVNTVRREGDRLIGENTDGKGFMRGLREEARIDPKGKEVVILGAGGAARAIAVELALAGVKNITLINRSVKRGRELSAHLQANTEVSVKFAPWSGIFVVPSEADVLVNATSIGLYPDIEALPAVNLDAASPHLLVCDAVPNPPETCLIREARQRGLATLTGLVMLVYQGAISFEMWTGLKAPEDIMRDALWKVFNG
jgi:shikimate dehydrogenase